MSKASTHESVQDALENLIEQFTDVFCFYRELVQNSLDAGTNRVDIYLEFLPPEKNKKEGVMIIHVDDYGEGMNRYIIEHELTRLFSSSKEKDLTKIGKFGIGFVSVFAIKPEAVIVDTSKDGEDWRVIFDKDKNFELRRLEYPVEGTKIQILKSCNYQYFKHFLKKSEDTVRFWCKHSEAEIYFQDELVNEPFDIPSPLKIHKTREEAEVVAGYTKESVPFYGFYNQGLTLMEGHQEFYKGIAFKIKSKYLEHTLTRDNIRKDENYWKAMEILEEITTQELPILLFQSLERELEKGRESHRFKQIVPFAYMYLKEPSSIPPKAKTFKIAKDVCGNYVSLGELIKMLKSGVIYYDVADTFVSMEFQKRKNKRVLLFEKDSELLNVVSSVVRESKGDMVCVSVHYFVPQILEPSDLSDVQRRLIDIVNAVNNEMKVNTPTPLFANFNYKGSCIANRVYVMQENPGDVSSVTELDKKGKITKSLFSIFSKSRTLVINKDHPYIEHILELAQHDESLASYFLIKLLYMDDGISTEVDTKLAELSMKYAKKLLKN